MGNIPLRRPSSANVPRRRAQSLAPVPAQTVDHSRMASFNSETTSNDEFKKPDETRRKMKTFRSSTNIANSASGGGSESSGGREKYTLSPAQRDLVKGNWEPNRERRYDIARRIYGRAFNKRPDVREVYERIGQDVWAEEAKRFADFMQAVIQNVEESYVIERLSLDLGRRHGDWRAQGFKPEFWVAFAESMTKECCYLDAAVHPAGEVLEAWSKLIGLIFGWARDGYYEKVRLQRRISRRNVTQSASISSPSLSNSSRSNSTDDPPAVGHTINGTLGSAAPTVHGFLTPSAVGY